MPEAIDRIGVGIIVTDIPMIRVSEKAGCSKGISILNIAPIG